MRPFYSRVVVGLLGPLMAALLAACAGVTHASRPDSDAEHALAAAVQGPCRTSDNQKRDVYRHPAQTLAFFGVRPDMSVVEITPGYGWYTEILASLLRVRGRYVAAVYAPDTSDRATNELLSGLIAKLRTDPGCFDRSRIVLFDLAAPSLGPAASADRVLTFRNVHNWEEASASERMFRAIAEVLKPDGYLGVTDHRADPSSAAPPRGYVSQARVIALARQAGLTLVASSEINANPRDTKDYQIGVWALPPTLALGAVDADKYHAIGESDRMTLLFRKTMTQPPSSTRQGNVH